VCVTRNLFIVFVFLVKLISNVSLSFHLQGGYPARLKKVLIVTAPLWFKAPFKILRLFVREKLRERVFTVSIPQLSLHVPRESLPIQLGGTLEIDHSTW
jgi:tyrosine-protein phosphatase non-receptor type 9